MRFHIRRLVDFSISPHGAALRLLRAHAETASALAFILTGNNAERALGSSMGRVIERGIVWAGIASWKGSNLGLMFFSRCTAKPRELVRGLIGWKSRKVLSSVVALHVSQATGR